VAAEPQRVTALRRPLLGLSNPSRSYLQSSSAILGRLTQSLGSSSLSELFPDHRSPASVKKRVHSAMDSIPSRVPRHLLDRPACYGRITDFPETLSPFNDILELAPCRASCSTLTPVPLSGFLNLSAVSQQTRVPRPYFIPQPFVGFLLQSFPLTKIVFTSLEATCSPAVIHQAAKTTTIGALLPPVSLTRVLLARLPCSTNSYGSPFHRPKPASQSPRTPSDTLPTYT